MTMTWNHEAAALTSDLYYDSAVVHHGHLRLLHTHGQVEELVEDLCEWKVVQSVGRWGAFRPFSPTMVVTREMLAC